eukprot:CAMPEP_0172504208 /NCGR_PEP_ID=MMETSP1066-20121228/176438_1 /TAXON_ID=671091 /ORGANISM="Coscinodiscus wailesii, Strain CCMP2513" /LENGTH=107 /DNA_ID=CAMNT_0013280273 /DNA_START=113 /DNA_END=436 /DNA_ORIENTATION=+
MSNLNNASNSSTNNSNDNKTHVYADDMTDEMRNQAVEIASDAFQRTVSKGKVYGTVATRIREAFDKEFGRGWSCVVGTSFGSGVTHEIKTYIYFSVVPGVNVLLWRS